VAHILDKTLGSALHDAWQRQQDYLGVVVYLRSVRRPLASDFADKVARVDQVCLTCLLALANEWRMSELPRQVTAAPRCRYADASEASCALMRLQQSSLEAALWATARLPRPLNRVMLPSSTRSLTDLERLAVRPPRTLAHEMRSGERPSLAQERQAHRLSKMLDAVTAEAGGRVLPRLTSVSNLNAQFSTVQESRR